MVDDMALRNVWISIFLRKGGRGRFTMPFEEFSEPVRCEVLGKIRLTDDELPVFLVRRTNSQMCLITTRHVHYFNDDHKDEFRITEIEDVKPDEFGVAPKREMNRLIIQLSKGVHFALELEGGAPFFGIWNVLLHAVERNKAARQT